MNIAVAYSVLLFFSKQSHHYAVLLNEKGAGREQRGVALEHKMLKGVRGGFSNDEMMLLMAFCQNAFNPF